MNIAIDLVTKILFVITGISIAIMVRCASTTLVSLIKLLGNNNNFAAFSSRVFFRWSKIPIYFQ